MRRLPIYFLIDTSGSMRGAQIDAVNACLKFMMLDFRSDPFLIEITYVCVVTFDLGTVVVVPLTAHMEVEIPHIAIPNSGPSHLGSALAFVRNIVQGEVRKPSHENKGDFRPVLIIMTDGKPSDVEIFLKQIPQVRALSFDSIVGCVTGPKKETEYLRSLCDDIFLLDLSSNPPFSLSSYLVRRWDRD